MKLLKKMSHAGLNNTTPAQVKALVDASESAVFIARIIGLVRGQEVISTPHGSSLKFKGEFRGWGIDGEEAMSPVAYLPSPFDELLSNQINDIQGEDGQAKVSVEFGLDVFAVKDKGTVGYKFIVKPLAEAAPSDPLAQLQKSFAPLQLPNKDAVKILAAPAEAEESTQGQVVGESAEDTPAKKAKAGK